ncbi:MAG: vWA domain-containing protein [Polyangiaceae bacterium]
MRHGSHTSSPSLAGVIWRGRDSRNTRDLAFALAVRIVLLPPDMRLVSLLGSFALLVVGCGTSTRSAAPSSVTADGGGAEATAIIDDDAAARSEPRAACPNVDVLFVIDNSGSMADKQARLAASFPGFANAIASRLPSAKTVHVGVVTTSAYYGASPQACLVRETSGPSSTQAKCLTQTSFLDGHDASFAPAFACIAKVGAGGDDDEKPIRGLLGALDPTNNGAGACNAGFARPDAILVVVIISDEDDVKDGDCDPTMGTGTCGSGGTPDEWKQQLVALRGGHPENVVVLSLLAPSGATCANAPTVNLAAFTHRFGARGAVGDGGAPSYDAFFSASLPLLDQACSDFVPPK